MKQKLILFSIALSLSASMISANTVVYSQDFENATVSGTLIGDTEAANYGGGAAWTFGLETINPITGTKSAYLNISNSGSDWWTLQYKIDSKFSVIQDARYKVTFNIKSSAPTTIMFKVLATANFSQNLNLIGGGTIQTFSIITTQMDRNGSDPNFQFSMGSPTVPAEIWIDDIVIEEIEEVYLPDGVVYSEDFENATASGNFIGDFEAANYGGGANWTYGLETTNPIAGTKSAYINIANSGSDWWNLQFKIESKFSVVQDTRYKVTFKIKSSVPTTIMFKVQATADFSQNLNLTGGGNVQDFSIITYYMDRSGSDPNFMFALGSPSVPAEIWIDDFLIEELRLTTLTNEINNKNIIDNIKVWKNNENLVISSSESCFVEIYNAIGQKISCFQVESETSAINLPTKSSFYIIKLTTQNNKTKILKFLN